MNILARKRHILTTVFTLVVLGLQIETGHAQSSPVDLSELSLEETVTKFEAAAKEYFGA